MALPYLNLPWLILIHSLALTTLGLAITFAQKPFPSPQLHGTNSMLGITTTTIGLAYLSTSYMPMEQNQFLYASVPVRLTVAALLTSAGLLNRGKMDKKGFRTHVGFALWDGLGAVWLGWYLGRFDGRCPGVA